MIFIFNMYNHNTIMIKICNTYIYFFNHKMLYICMKRKIKQILILKFTLT